MVPAGSLFTAGSCHDAPMPLLPELQPIIDAARNNRGSAPSKPPPIAEARAGAHTMMDQMFTTFAEPGPEVATVVDHLVPVDGGEITARVFTPHGPGPFGCHVHFHGGGFWLGTLDHAESECRHIADGANCVVVTVDYRLAPEHKYPTAAEDCYAALCWVADQASELNIDTRRISIGGESAGGNLTAVVALMARDREGPALVLQVLEIPVTDLTMSQPSIESNGEGYLLERPGMDQYRRYYAEESEWTEPYASPLLADDLGGLPSALVMTCEFDPLRDEGEAYAERLEAAGVEVHATRWEGHFHGSCAMTALTASARQYRNEIVEAIRRAHGSGGRNR